MHHTHHITSADTNPCTDAPHHHRSIYLLPRHHQHTEMATSASAAAAAAFKAEGHSCFVIGYTGEVGKELVKVCTS